MISDFQALGHNIKLETFETETLSVQLRNKGTHGFDCKILNKLLQPGDYFIDGGANLGWFSIIASKIVGDTGKVFAIEPEEKNYKMLENNVRLNNCNNVKLIKYGLWKQYEEMQIYLNPENYGDHSLSPNTYRRCFYPDEKNIQKEHIEVARLDHLVSESDFKKVKLIKLDIQGSEPAALRGMEWALRYNKPAIILEFSPAHIYDAGCSPFDIFGFIETNNYKMYKLADLPPYFASPEPEPINIHELFDFLKQNLTTYVGIDLLLLP